MKKLKLSIVTLFVLLFFVLIAMGSSGKTAEAVKAIDTTGTTQPKATSAAAVFNVGEKVKIGDLEITLNSVRFDAGSEYIKPDAGQKWLVANCTLDNKGTTSASISSLMMFKLNDDEGYSRDLQLMAETEGSMDGALAAGGKMRGEIAFTVKDTSANFQLLFEPNILGEEQVIFNIPASSVK